MPLNWLFKYSLIFASKEHLHGFLQEKWTYNFHYSTTHPTNETQKQRCSWKRLLEKIPFLNSSIPFKQLWNMHLYFESVLFFGNSLIIGDVMKFQGLRLTKRGTDQTELNEVVKGLLEYLNKDNVCNIFFGLIFLKFL